jgi:hypothetical protein
VTAAEPSANFWPVRGERPFAVLVFVLVLALYVRTAAPGIVIEGDGAEYTAAAMVGGVPHQPGYATYMCLAWPLARMAGAEHAARALALLSAFFGALAVALASLVTLRLLRRARADAPLACAFVASAFGALALAGTTELWNQSLSAEVYSLSAALLAWVLLLTLASARADRLAWAALASGLAYGVHYNVGGPTMLLVLVFAWRERRALGRRGLVRVGAAFVLGLATFLYLPLRSLADPAIDYGDPETPARVWRALVLADMPTGKAILRPFGLLADQVLAVLELVPEQWPLAVLVLAFVGFGVACVRRELRGFAAAGAGIVLVNYVGILANANFELEPERIYELRFLFLPAYVVVALAAALALGTSLSFLARRGPTIALAAGGVACLALAPGLVQRFAVLDKHANRVFPDYGRALLAVPEGPAIVFAFGDNAALILAYLQIVERERPDVVVIAAGLLRFPWYREQLRQQHPELVVAEAASGVVPLARDNAERFRLYHAQPEPQGFAGFVEVPTGVLMRILPQGAALEPLVPPPPEFTAAWTPRDMRERSVRADVAMGYVRTAEFWRGRGDVRTALAACEAGLALVVPEPRMEEFHLARAALLLALGDAELGRGRRTEARAAWEAARAESSAPEVAELVERRLGMTGG